MLECLYHHESRQYSKGIWLCVWEKERQQRILHELQVHPHVRVATLAERFDVATETIRRDLDALSNEGLIKREFGGASARPMGHQPDLAERQLSAVAGFERIGMLAADMVRSGDVAMIDAGSTVAQIAPFLAARRSPLPRTFLTNCYAVVQGMADLCDYDDVLMCPGQYDRREMRFTGRIRLNICAVFMPISPLSGHPAYRVRDLATSTVALSRSSAP